MLIKQIKKYKSRPKRRVVMLKQSGFTLVETMLYSLLLGIVLTSFIYFALAVASSKEKNSDILEMNAGLRPAMDVISRELRQSNGLLAANGGILEFYDSENDLSILDLSENRIRLISKSGVSYLTGSDYQVEELNFEIVGRNKRSARISFRSQSADGSYSHNFQTAVSLRK